MEQIFLVSWLVTTAA